MKLCYRGYLPTFLIRERNMGCLNFFFHGILAKCAALSEVFISLFPANDLEISSVTEWSTETGRRIDIVLKIIDNSGQIRGVIGIENKIFSGEQRNQVRDYQTALQKHFPNIPQALIFLTPDGRAPLSADCDSDCPAIVVSFDLIADVCHRIGTQANGQAQTFLSILECHLRKITNTNAMDEEAAELVQKLYQNPEYRQAIKIIGQYSPTLRKCFDSLTNLLVNGDMFPFTMTSAAVEYYPKSSTSPTEYKIKIDALSRLVESKGLYPVYMLHCDTPNPDIDDIFSLRIMVWNSIVSGRNYELKELHRKKILNSFSFPPALSPKKEWGGWVCVWSGGTYKLSDLGQVDVEGLASLLERDINKTYDEFRIGLKKLSSAKF